MSKNKKNLDKIIIRPLTSNLQVVLITKLRQFTNCEGDVNCTTHSQHNLSVRYFLVLLFRLLRPGTNFKLFTNFISL